VTANHATGWMVRKPELIPFTTIRHRGPLATSRSSRSLLAATLTLLSGGFQLAVALSVNLDLSACKHVPHFPYQRDVC
jgi:hypothetical protein